MPKINIIPATENKTKPIKKTKKKVPQSTLDALAKGRAKMMANRKKK